MEQQLAQAESNRPTTYYLHSSVLGGAVVAEIRQVNSVWQRQRSYVYANGKLLATQVGNEVEWLHAAPLTGSQRRTTQAGVVDGQAEMDPLGVDAGLSDDNENASELFYPRYGHVEDYRAGCQLAGMMITCDFADSLVALGYAEEVVPYSAFNVDLKTGEIRATGSGLIGVDAIFGSEAVTTIYSDGTSRNSHGELTAGTVGSDGHAEDTFDVDMAGTNNWSVMLHIGADFASTGIPQNSGFGRLLTGERRRQYVNARDNAQKQLHSSDPCREFLNRLGISPNDVAKTINRQIAYDATKSTITMAGAGLLASSERDANMSVEAYFSLFGTHAATALAGGTRTRNDVYFGQNGFQAQTIIHEALHTLLGISNDIKLAQRLGMSPDEIRQVYDKGSTVISDKLAAAGCGGG